MHSAIWCRHTCLFLPALHRFRSKSIIASGSVSCAAVSPAESTACSVCVEKQDSSRLVLYAGRWVTSRTSSIVERAMKISHLLTHVSKESFSASRSNGGGLPYGLNARGVDCCAAATAAAAAAAMAASSGGAGVIPLRCVALVPDLFSHSVGEKTIFYLMERDVKLTVVGDRTERRFVFFVSLVFGSVPSYSRMRLWCCATGGRFVNYSRCVWYLRGGLAIGINSANRFLNFSRNTV